MSAIRRIRSRNLKMVILSFNLIDLVPFISLVEKIIIVKMVKN